MNYTEKEIQNFGKKIIKILKTIYDPEIPVDIYELGLIYDIFISNEGNAEILMTLTSPNCPVAETLPLEVEKKITSIKGIKSTKIKLTFEPSWTKDLMSETAKFELGFL